MREHTDQRVSFQDSFGWRVHQVITRPVPSHEIACGPHCRERDTENAHHGDCDGLLFSRLTLEPTKQGFFFHLGDDMGDQRTVLFKEVVNGPR